MTYPTHVADLDPQVEWMIEQAATQAYEDGRKEGFQEAMKILDAAFEQLDLHPLNRD